MKKNWLRRGILFSLSLLLMCSVAFAAGVTYQSINVQYADIKLIIDGKEVTPKDVNGKETEPFIYDGTTFVPARAVAEALNKKVAWNFATKSVIIGDSDDLANSQPTLKNLFEVAIKPVGNTMYVWGGAWNEADTGAGVEAVSIGVSPRWSEFAKQQTSSYNFQKTRYQIHDGLDCSGYIGWAIYNLFNTTNGNEGYVMKASTMAENFSKRGWGTYTPIGSVKEFAPGSIMSSKGHAYISLGTCSDGSVVLLHSSTPGVQIAGTVTPTGSKNSEAIQLATKYMSTYYPQWYSKFKNVTCDISYLNSYGQMTWDVTGKAALSDPDGFINMTPAEILAKLYT